MQKIEWQAMSATAVDADTRDLIIDIFQTVLAAYDHDRGDGRPLYTVPGDDRSDDLKCDYWSIAGRIRFALEKMGAPEVREEN